MKKEENLFKLLHKLKRLKRDRNKKIGAAPHKPILILAIIQEIKNGNLLCNKVSITPELVLSFKDIWSKLVLTSHTPNFALPFYHMKTESFWKLCAHRGDFINARFSNSIKSLNSLKEYIAFAKIEDELFTFLADDTYRKFIEDELLDFYFPETKNDYFKSKNSFQHELKNQVLNDDKIIYTERINMLKSEMKENAFEEEVFIRSGIFKREIPKIYNYKCAVSGLRIETTTNAQLVDACHIIPFSISKDDTVRNGLCLTPTIHRAFDRGIITIDDNYLVNISSCISEVESPYSLKQFDQKRINLPQNQKYHPLIENLFWHKKEYFLTT